MKVNENNVDEGIVDPQINNENDNLDTNTNLDVDVDEINQDIVVNIDEDVSKQQSEDKKHSANSVFAEMRRDNERLKAELQKRDEDTSKLDSIIKELYADNGVNDSKGLVGYVDDVKKEQEKQDLIDKGIDPDLLSKLVQKQLEDNPIYKQMKVKEQDDKISIELSEFGNDYPQYADSEVKDLPNVQAVMKAKNERGLTFSEAFAIVNRKEIFNQKAIDIKNEVKKQYASSSINRGSQGAVGATVQVVTSEDISIWKQVYSGYSDVEITAMINKSRGIN